MMLWFGSAQLICVWFVTDPVANSKGLPVVIVSWPPIASIRSLKPSCIRIGSSTLVPYRRTWLIFQSVSVDSQVWAPDTGKAQKSQ